MTGGPVGGNQQVAGSVRAATADVRSRAGETAASRAVQMNGCRIRQNRRRLVELDNLIGPRAGPIHARQRRDITVMAQVSM